VPNRNIFLIDKKLHDQRKDLIYTGRTLFGAMPPKGQEMDDHYYGAFKERISAFMKELDRELWKLGVSAKTKHNEVRTRTARACSNFQHGQHCHRPQPVDNGHS